MILSAVPATFKPTSFTHLPLLILLPSLQPTLLLLLHTHLIVLRFLPTAIFSHTSSSLLVHRQLQSLLHFIHLIYLPTQLTSIHLNFPAILAFSVSAIFHAPAQRATLESTTASFERCPAATTSFPHQGSQSLEIHRNNH